MEIEGKDVLILGGAGLVGTAVCHEMLASCPASLVVASRQRQRAEQAVERLKAAFPESATRIIAISGDVFIRAEWQEDAKGPHPRAAVLGWAASASSCHSARTKTSPDIAMM
jgi:FlaA1/EpsC-like NDP-sugar epimerase